MHLCPTVLLSLAFTLTLFLFDLGYNQYNTVFSHLIYNSIVTALFFALCKMGYETVNWICIAVFMVLVLGGWMIAIAYSERSNALAIYNRQQCNILNTSGTNPPDGCTGSGAGAGAGSGAGSGSGSGAGDSKCPETSTTSSKKCCDSTVCTYA